MDCIQCNKVIAIFVKQYNHSAPKMSWLSLRNVAHLPCSTHQANTRHPVLTDLYYHGMFYQINGTGKELEHFDGNWHQSQSTWSIRYGPDKGGQHLDSGSGIGVMAKSILHFPTEPVHDVLQCVIREAHGVQVLINLREKHRQRRAVRGF